MLKHGEVNPLNVHGLRRMEHCPPHFTQIEFNIYVSEKTIADWIWANLGGRFFFGDMYQGSGKSYSSSKVAAFELPGEASYFSLVLDTINKNPFSDF